MKSWFVPLLVVLSIPAERVRSAEASYDRDIRPLLAAKCAACHGALKQEAGLRLDAGVFILRGGDDGRVIVSGKASDSRLLQRVQTDDPDMRMPPPGEGERLTKDEVSLLAAWINAGAVVPADETLPIDPRQHWSFQPLQRPQLPDPSSPDWSHPVDAFISRGHAQRGLKPVDLADRATLLRRIYFDLIGLPPTRAQLHAFLGDDSPQAWERVVDSLLESPHYGERWGRHWMDVWRYSDWDGYKDDLRGSQRHIWHWRDWIIESLNADKGYDRMVVEMLAADELAPQDRSALAATGFLARNYHNRNRNIWLDATVEHTAKAFLGLTLNCARCHDHKYDPLPQAAYYQFRGIFEPHGVRTDVLPGEPDILKDGLPRAYDSDLTAPTYVYRQGNDKHPDKEHPVQASVPDVLGGRLAIQPVALPVESYFPWLQEFVVEQKLSAARKRVESAARVLETDGGKRHEENASAEEVRVSKEKSVERRLRHSLAERELQSLEARLAADRVKYADGPTHGDSSHFAELAHKAAALERQSQLIQANLDVETKQQAVNQAESTAAGAAAGQSGSSKKVQPPRVPLEKARQDLAEAQKKQQAAQAALEQSDTTYTSVGPEYPRTSSGRRLALANWLTAPTNPLTARVAVNHIWLRHFGTPLVENVFDFGLRSPRPHHQELLDWLAVELMENRWSMKHLHRLILTSRAWRLASSAAEFDAAHNIAVDPDNLGLWRMNVRRLDAEVIRDNVLAVAGQLELTRGGPDIDFELGETSRRRSIYLRHAYEKQMTMLVIFDAASPTECYRRSESIIPQQALALANSSLSLGQSRQLARQLWREDGTNPPQTQLDFVVSAFEQILSRLPSEAEKTVCLEFLAEQERTLSDPAQLTTFAGGTKPAVKPASDPHQRARENLVHVLMNHNDFVSVR